jgi:hypothetical protein
VVEHDGLDLGSVLLELLDAVMAVDGGEWVKDPSECFAVDACARIADLVTNASRSPSFAARRSRPVRPAMANPSRTPPSLRL